MRRMTMAALALGASLLAAPLGAQSPAGSDAATSAISQLRSPYCPGLMLEVCPSPQAGLLRDSIHALAAGGMGTGELVEWMIARHGEEYRGVPRSRGKGLWAWLIPPLALLGGAAVVAVRLRNGRAQAVVPPDESGQGISDAERARLAAALREMERTEELDA